MKKRIFAIAFVISVIIGLSACKNPPIFAAIEQEVKLNPASVKGRVRGIVKIGDTLYASNGKIWYKEKGKTGKWSEMKDCPSGLCTGLAVDDPDLYAAFEQSDTFAIHWYDPGTKSWTKVPGLTAQAVFGSRLVFAIESGKSGNATTYTIRTIEHGMLSAPWTSPTDKAPVGAAGLYCLLEDGLYKKDRTKIPGSPSSGLKGICEGPTDDSVFVVDNTKLYCYDGNTSTWTNIVHGVSSPQSITYLENKHLVLISSGIKGYGEIKLAGNAPTLAGAQSIKAGSADSSVPPGNILQYNNSVGKYVINPIYAFDSSTGYVIYAGINDPNTRYTGLWGFYNPGQIEWNRE
jgi:uncharacterized lipoprotein TP_0136